MDAASSRSGNGDLDVDDVLRAQTWDGGRADMVDAESSASEGRLQPSLDFSVLVSPSGLIVEHHNQARAHVFIELHEQRVWRL